MSYNPRRRKEWWSELPEERREEIRQKNREYHRANKVNGKTYNQRYYQKLKLETFQHYSGYKEPICTCCGFSDMRALCLDHVNGNGAEDRRKYHGSVHLFRHLRDTDYPQGYQVLCANCNYIKAAENQERGYKSL